MIKQPQTSQWLRSSFCASGGCVEVARAEDRVLLRDSKHPEAGPLEFTAVEWAAFLEGARKGEFDFA